MNQLQPDVSSPVTASISCRSRVLDYDLARWATELRPHLDSKGQSLRRALEATPLPPVRYDRDKLHQAIVNLVHDAHTFTDAGGRIALAARAAGDIVTIEVRDTATSVPESGRTAGRGLAIAREIIELHGGSISVQNDPTGGNTFAFSIPVHKPQADALSAA